MASKSYSGIYQEANTSNTHRQYDEQSYCDAILLWAKPRKQDISDCFKWMIHLV
ncbi:MAG: hypothetical protein ABSC01_14660 [Verrucomicrobiota bacterium]